MRKKIIFLMLFSATAAKAQSIPDELFKAANSPIVAVGGFINTAAAHRLQSRAYENDRLPDAVISNGQVDVARYDSTHNTLGTHNRYSSKEDFVNDSEIYIKVGAISNSKLKYGAIVELAADTTPNGRGNGFNADKTFIFTESVAGKFEFGNNLAANQKMKVGPALFARAAGGINGKYLEHINAPILANSSQLSGEIVCSGSAGVDANGLANTTNCAQVKLPRFILIPQSPIGHGGYGQGFYNGNGLQNSDGTYNLTNDAGPRGSFNNNNLQNSGNAVNAASAGFGIKNGAFGQMEDATKISYYTPRINGWQFGSSFTSSTGNTGTTAVISGKNSGNIENVLSWGLNYSTSVGSLGVAASATGEHGQFQNSKLPTTAANQLIRNRLNAYDAGLMFTYFGFTVGASYGYWGNSLQPNQGIYSCNYNAGETLNNQTCSTAAAGKKFTSANYYSTGLAYEFGPAAVSLTTISSSFQQNKYQAQSLGIDYKIARGLMPYFEITKFKFIANQPRASNISTTAVQIFNNKGYVGLVVILLAF